MRDPLLPSRRILFGAALGVGACALALGRRATAQPAFEWPGGARAAVSLTYDDGLNSQLDHAVPELDRRGFKATFFLTAENVREGRRLAEWEQVARHGHEVANHTVNHPCALQRMQPERFELGEIDAMESYLDANFGSARPRTYAYPCGYLGIGGGDRRERFARYRQILERDGVVAARTTTGAPNRPAEAVADRFNLHAFEPTGEADITAPARRYLTHAASQGAWAILVFHDILPRWETEGDASIGVHRAILQLVADSGFWVAPMGQVFEHLQAHHPAAGHTAR